MSSCAGQRKKRETEAEQERYRTQRAKSRGFHRESPGIVAVGGGNPRGDLGCK